MKTNRFFKNALWLTVTGFILRGLGMLLRVYISGKLGEEGMGLYQLVSSAYFLFITFAQSGIPVAVTRLCAGELALGDTKRAYGVLRCAIVLALCTGILSMLAMFSLSGILAKYWLADMRTVPAMRVLSLSLPFISVCNVLSAYNTARRRVYIGCTAQIIEQIVRMSAVALTALAFADKGLGVSLAMVFAANTLSEAVSCMYYAMFVAGEKRRYGKPKVNATRDIVRNAVPVALSRYLASLLRSAENTLVPAAMTVFYLDRTEALSWFGALRGMAIPLLFFPSSFLNALSTLLVPEITEASVKKDAERMSAVIERVCFFTLTLSIMTAGVFMLFSDSLGKIVYGSEKVSYLLFWLAPLVPFMYLDSICDGLLKGLGLQKQVLYHGSIDSGSRIILTALFAPRYGINGFLAVMYFSNIFISLINFRLLLKKTNVKCNTKDWFLIPALCTGLSAIVTNFFVRNSATVTKTFLGALMFCALFIVLTIIFYSKDKFQKIK